MKIALGLVLAATLAAVGFEGGLLLHPAIYPAAEQPVEQEKLPVVTFSSVVPSYYGGPSYYYGGYPYARYSYAGRYGYAPAFREGYYTRSISPLVITRDIGEDYAPVPPAPQSNVVEGAAPEADEITLDNDDPPLYVRVTGKELIDFQDWAMEQVVSGKAPVDEWSEVKGGVYVSKGDSKDVRSGQWVAKESFGACHTDSKGDEIGSALMIPLEKWNEYQSGDVPDAPQDADAPSPPPA